MVSKSGGGTKTPPQHHLPAGLGRECHGGQTLWSLHHMGGPWSSQGCFYWGGGQEADFLYLQWDQLALCSRIAVWGHLPCTTPQGWALGHPTSERNQGHPWWADQPTCGLPTPCHQLPSHLPHRFEQAGWAHYNLPTRATGQQHKPYCRQTYLLGDWYSITSKWSCTKRYHLLVRYPPLIVASPHKFPPQSEGIMTMEVRNLLSWAVLEMSSCRSEHSSPRRPTPVAVPMTPPQKPERPSQPVDTSSWVSAKVAEASLEDIPPSSPQSLPFPGPEVLPPSGWTGALGKCQQSPWGFPVHQGIHRCP